MIPRNRLCSKIGIWIVFVGLLFLVTGITEEALARNIVLKVVGPDGKTLAGAKVSKHFLPMNAATNGKEYICDSNGIICLAEEDVFKYKYQQENIPVESCIFYCLYESKLAGFAKVIAEDAGEELEIKLTPACRVYGEIKSTDLKTFGQEMNETSADINDLCLPYSGKNGEFEFFLPEGAYKLSVYGEKSYGKCETINISAGQKELKKDFDLPAERLFHLIGKPAPELQEMTGWINSKPIKLADLRGKVVLLDFWHRYCGGCITGMPKLVDLHEKYHSKGLVIISIHADMISGSDANDLMNPVKALEKTILEYSKNRWNGRKIPFAIALDRGGYCRIEGTEEKAPGATAAVYGIQSFPTIVLIDKQGKVIKEYDPHGKDIALLEKLLAAEP